MDRQIMDTLEEAIDRYGLGVIVEALGDICGEKAAHIEENWQDAVTARPWRTAGNRLFRTVASLEKLALPKPVLPQVRS